jgi:hypothetical protein
MQGRMLISGFVVMALSGLASGQNALGDGRALDNNLSVESRYNYQRPNLADEIRFRNAIATGNAPGGMSFRGDVGYLAPGEFSAELGSDELFAFRRDSMYSGLAGMGIRGTEALQFQFSLATGGRPPEGLLGSMTYLRDARPLGSPEPFAGGPNDVPTIGRQRPTEFEETGTMMGALRSPSAYEVNRSFAPVLLGSETLESGETVGLTASSLRGVRRVEMSQGPTGADERVYTAAGPLPTTRIETSYLWLMEQYKTASGVEAAAGGPGSEEQPTIPEWQQRLMDLRDGLNAPVVVPVEPAEPAAGTERSRLLDAPFRADAETVARLLAATKPVENFVPPDALGVYAEHMRAGQALMGGERYFDAEERFAHALTIRPGDVTAQAARMNAQIGAGMYLSAAVNLRTLMLSFPELSALKYERGLMPSAMRLTEVREQLRAYAALGENETPRLRDLRLARASGSLLAYIGFQSGDSALVTEGLSASRRALRFALDAEPTAEDDQDQRLLDFLEQVWTKTPGG